MDLKYFNPLNENELKYQDVSIEKISDYEYRISLLIDNVQPLTNYFEKETLTIPVIINLGIDIGSALADYHNNGIMLGNLSSDNIFLDQSGNFRILGSLSDFLTEFFNLETIDSLASEFLSDPNSIDESADIFSLGLVLNEGLQKLDTYLLPIELVNDLKNVIIKATLDQDNRYQTINEFLNELISINNALSVYSYKGNNSNDLFYDYNPDYKFDDKDEYLNNFDSNEVNYLNNRRKSSFATNLFYLAFMIILLFGVIFTIDQLGFPIFVSQRPISVKEYNITEFQVEEMLTYKISNNNFYYI